MTDMNTAGAGSGFLFRPNIRSPGVPNSYSPTKILRTSDGPPAALPNIDARPLYPSRDFDSAAASRLARRQQQEGRKPERKGKSGGWSSNKNQTPQRSRSPTQNLDPDPLPPSEKPPERVKPRVPGRPESAVRRKSGVSNATGDNLGRPRTASPSFSKPPKLSPPTPMDKDSSSIDAATIAQAMLAGEGVKDLGEFHRNSHLMMGSASAALRSLQEAVEVGGGKSVHSKQLPAHLRVVALSSLIEKQRRVQKMRHLDRRAQRRQVGTISFDRDANVQRMLQLDRAKRAKRGKTPDATSKNRAEEIRRGSVNKNDLRAAKEETDSVEVDGSRAGEEGDEVPAIVDEDAHDHSEDEGQGKRARTMSRKMSVAITLAPNPASYETFLKDEEHYRGLVQVFEDLDRECTGRITWQQLSEEFAMQAAARPDFSVFKKLDRGSNRVGFPDALRVCFPKAPSREIARAIARWGQPRAEDREGEVSTNWRDKYGETVTQELEEIYYVMTRKKGEGRGLSRADIQRVLPESAVVDDGLNKFFNQFDVDRDGALSLNEFAAIMDETYRKEEESTTEVALFYA